MVEIQDMLYTLSMAVGPLRLEINSGNVFFLLVFREFVIDGQCIKLETGFMLQ